MGLFKKLVGDIAKTVGESLEEVSNEAKKSFQEAREEVRKNIQEAKQNQFNSDDDDDDDNWDYPLTKLSDDDDDIRIQLGTFKNGVLTIDEGHTTLGEDALEGYKKIRKVVFPSTLREIDGCFFSEHGHEESLEEVDFSKVKLLKEIPDGLFENCERLQKIDIPEGVEIIGSSVFDSCTNLRKITFPSTLKSLQSTTYECEMIEELDLSKVHLLEEIPEYFISENCDIQTLVIPVGVKIVGDEFASSKSIREVYVPYTVEKIGTLNDDEYSPEGYIYTNKLTDIESLCAYIKTLYVPEELYVYYAELLKEVDDTEVRLRKMPADKLDFYGTPVPPLTEVAKEEETQDTQEESQDTQEEILDIQKESEEIPTIQKSPGNLFSDALEELINSAAASDELTDKMKEIVLRRAVKEGEDPDEVEMVLEARFYEKHN
jgi:hypothetical protein